MGCGASKENEDPDQIKHEMKKTWVAELDDFFNSASEVLSTLEDLRTTFKEPVEEMHELGRTEELVDVKLIEAVKLFFWSCSAHKEGQIMKCGPKFDTDPPALTIECGDMDWHTWDFSDALKKLVGGLTEGPKKVADVVQKMPEIAEKFKDVSANFKEKIEGAGLKPMDKMKAIANTGLNVKTVGAGLAKFPKVIESVKENLKEAAEMAKGLPEALKTADENGKKAHAGGHKRLNEIFEHIQPAPKKTKEQLEAYRKEKESKGEKKKARPSKHGGKAAAGDKKAAAKK